MINWEQELIQLAGAARTEESMRMHTTFQVGGSADFFVEADSAEKIASVRKLCRQQEVPCYVIGKGSNLLVGDGGIRGVVLHIGDGMSGCRVIGAESEAVKSKEQSAADEEAGTEAIAEAEVGLKPESEETGRRGYNIEAQAGITLAALARTACNAGLQGLEFAAGIPGSLGGAVYMNAGAYGGEMKDVLTEVQVMDPDGEIAWIPAEEMRFGYRTSRAAEEGLIVLAARFALKVGDPAVIRERMAELAGKRRSKQPLEYPSAGSTFKRPEGYFAGKLIQDAGLAGYTVGGAQVSEKHCGFVINKDGASAADILKLCKDVQAIVHEKYGVDLEMEVKCLGEF